MQSKIVILGTGGTIAGTAASASDAVGYTAAQIGVAQLVEAVPALAGLPIECEQVAQLDSKDMDHATWQQLAQRVADHLGRDEISGIVVTHGTDTLEETAYFLQRVLAPTKPVVLAAAMRPATALLADGPQNLLDAVTVARAFGACGVVAVLAGQVFSAMDVRKVHTYRLDAFGAGDAGALARVEEGDVRVLRAWPTGKSIGGRALTVQAELWPRVEIVLSHAGATGTLVRALCSQGVDGIVVAASGNGSVHQDVELALRAAQQQGIAVLRSTRCPEGPIVEPAPGDREALPSAGHLSPVKARIELMLELLERS